MQISAWRSPAPDTDDGDGLSIHDLERQPGESLRAVTPDVTPFREERRTDARARRDGPGPFGLSRIVGQSTALRRVVEQVHQVATTDSTVLLLGETGTGKELFATQIHERSARRGSWSGRMRRR